VVLAAIIVAVILLHGGGSGASANVPLVNGESYSQAAAQIKAAGLVPVANKVASPSVKAGLVISTNPDNGNSVPKNSTVTVNVSTGVANIALPNLTGSQGVPGGAAAEEPRVHQRQPGARHAVDGALWPD